MSPSYSHTRRSLAALRRVVQFVAQGPVQVPPPAPTPVGSLSHTTQ